eukprot:TRINITY_DN8013_c0_g1_i1.p1 TRINITY_DN8013_c0_g1~~TRINITY_DN8013_c0_g1_i1.p1  ORF type:complete len:260 (+),score=49.92 TRINITY_DN8013_c0_g1_i1:153-932(+)
MITSLKRISGMCHSTPRMTPILPHNRIQLTQTNGLNLIQTRGKKMMKPYKEVAKDFATEEDAEELRESVKQHQIFDWLRDPDDFMIVNETINIGRHVKITAGGRVYSFSALVICGNCDGIGALGYGKATTAIEAVEKAVEDAQKNFIAVYRYQGRTIPYSMMVKNRSTKLMMAANKEGSGVKGAYPLRVLAKAIGLDDVTFKIYRSHNIHNVLRAVFKAMTDITPPEDLAKKMGKKFINVAHYWDPRKDREYQRANLLF